MEGDLRIAVVGGTGALGFGLVHRFAKAGFSVCIGSRDPASAAEKAKTISSAKPVGAASYEGAAKEAEVVILAVPFASHDAILGQIAAVLNGKILIDVTAPVQPPKVSVVQLPGGRSVCEATQERLGATVRVVSAFQNVAAAKLLEEGDAACDVLVCGDDIEARKLVLRLIEAIGMHPINAGPIANSIAAEALTAVLIGVNKTYKAHHAGIRLTGLEHMS